VQVLERGQLAVDERLVTQVADHGAVRKLELAAARRVEAASIRRSVVFPEPFGPVTSRKPPASSATSSGRRRACGRSASERLRAVEH
jgi:hypothetical protein